MRDPTNEEKVAVLERIVRAVFGRPDGIIEYKHFGGEELLPQVNIECDIEDAVKVQTNLQISGGIEMTFWDEGFMRDAVEWEKGQGAPEKVPDARVFAELFIEREYWKEIESLKKELAKYKEVKPNES